MRNAVCLLILICLSLCACNRDSSGKLGGIGEDKGWLSEEKTREAAMQVVLNHYPQAELTSTLGEGRLWTFFFSTNGVAATTAVVVDRESGKTHFEKVSR
jgi:hypothetical protein